VTQNLTWIIAATTFVALLFSLATFVKTRSRTKVDVYWEATTEHANVPAPIQLKTFEFDLIRAVHYLNPGPPEGIFERPITIRLIVRVSRVGVTPTLVEYVELGINERKLSLNRIPAKLGSAVRTIDAGSHIIKKFDFAGTAIALARTYPIEEMPDIAIRVMTHGRVLRSVKPLKSKDVVKIIQACQRVVPNYIKL
jgi:hypothetical protein